MPDLSLEQKFSGPVCGIDEVGRGPLAGPVVAGCVYIPPHAVTLPFWSDVNDSKKIPLKKRDRLAELIKANTIWGLGQASVEEIDTHNILQATYIAMRRAYDAMIKSNGSIQFTSALIDGNRTPPGFPVSVMTVIKGDQISLSIAAASIIAKVARDQMMIDLDGQYPGYGWARNAGYGTALHLRAIQEYGVTPHHRHSFAPVRLYARSNETAMHQGSNAILLNNDTWCDL